MERVSLDDILLPEQLYKVRSKTVIYGLEREGRFPRRHYFDADSPRPRRPFWLRHEVEQWLQEQIRQAEEARARAGLTGARLVEARHLKAA